jgi:hypothetical protein
MKRTQVYLDDHQPQQVEIISKVMRKSQAETIRDALEIGLQALRKQTSNASGLQALVDLGKKYNIQAPPDMSRRIDDYLYGDED